MAINSLYTTTRLMGLSSGMDTESIVKNLMKIEQLKLNKDLRAKTTLQWRQDALKSVAKDMTSFRHTFLTTLGADGMLSSGTYTSYNVALTGSNKDAISINATSEAALKKVTVNKIVHLAEAASIKSSNKVSGAGQTELSEGNYVKLGDLNFASDLFVGTKEIEVPRLEQAKNANGELLFKDSAGNAYYQDTMDSTKFYDVNGVEIPGVDASTLTAVMTTAKDSNGDIIYDTQTVADDTIQFSINGVDFEFTKDTTLAQMFSTVNNSKAGVTMTYSRLTDSFSISSKDTGDTSTLSIENKRGNAFGTGSAFGIGEYGKVDENGDPVGSAALTGSNAVVYIEGTRVERSTNSFTIDGIRYTLNYTTGTETAAEKTTGVMDQNNTPAADAITANLTQNVDASVDKIKKFVEGYNTMVNKLYSLVTEKKNSAYYALTDEEKSAMTENQIKEWETMAKSGLLRNDRDIQSVLSQLRTAFYTTVQGTGFSPQDIGLRTSYGTMSGEITINENDLRAALERDSDGVMRVFMQDPDSGKTEEKGLLYRLEDIIKDYTEKTQYNTLSSLDKNLTKLTDKIYDMENRLATLEEKYYLKYAAMETALSKMQSQTNWISSMLGTTNQ